MPPPPPARSHRWRLPLLLLVLLVLVVLCTSVTAQSQDPTQQRDQTAPATATPTSVDQTQQETQQQQQQQQQQQPPLVSGPLDGLASGSPVVGSDGRDGGDDDATPSPFPPLPSHAQSSPSVATLPAATRANATRAAAEAREQTRSTPPPRSNAEPIDPAPPADAQGNPKPRKQLPTADHPPNTPDDGTHTAINDHLRRDDDSSNSNNNGGDNAADDDSTPPTEGNIPVRLHGHGPAVVPKKPETVPTYDLTHSRSTSAPPNTPPLMPDAPRDMTAPPPDQQQPQQQTLTHRSKKAAAGTDSGTDTPKPVATTPPPTPSSDQAADAKEPDDDSSNGSKDAGGDDDQVVSSDDPHSLPIPGTVHSPSGFPQPERSLGREDSGNTKARPPKQPTPQSSKKTQQQTASASAPHDPMIHITPPPTGGWRAADLRKREAKVHEERRKEDEKYSNSYISSHGPSAELRRNQSQWYGEPDIQGPMPQIADPASYTPAETTAYWMPDEVHVMNLHEQRAKHRKHKVHREGLGARTTRLAAVDSNQAPSRIVEIRENGMLYVEGRPFWIQGICYSPVPIGESVSFTPKGDYFTPDYAYIWQRDLPMMKAMGATTLRIYGWAANADHTMFLDAVHAAGLKVLVTYYLGDAEQNPVFTVDQRNQILIDFVAQVHRYADHPAILMWSFGNELNGAWNGFAKQFSDAFGCWWQAGCAGYSDTNSDCQWQSSCMYYHLFSWINAACRAAKVVTTRPIISGFADVDYMVGPTPWLDKVARFNYLLPDMDAWAVQLYRGYTFGGYFGMYRGESWKPMIVTEFGVDAYNDACGWPENNQGGCFNMANDPAGGAEDNGHFWGCAEGGECGKPGVQAQAEWDVRLAQELMNQYIDRGGIVWGGFLMAWTDEWWKGGGTQDLCAFPCKTWDEAWCRGGGRDAYRPGGSAMCSYKAHFTCPNFDTNYHDLCGYFLAAAPDNYVNEEWFGITAPIDCGLHKVASDGVDIGYKLNSLYVRPAYLQVMQLWTGMSEVNTEHTTCAALRPCWLCATTHDIGELNDGACEKECAIPHELARGPGSSAPHPHKSLGGTLLHGSDAIDSFWRKFGLPLLAGVIVLATALAASVYLYTQRKAAKNREGLGPAQPLLQDQRTQAAVMAATR